MFARNVSFHLKPNSSVAFTKQVETKQFRRFESTQAFKANSRSSLRAGLKLSPLAFGIRRKMPTPTLGAAIKK